jgi:amino acid transporter
LKSIPKAVIQSTVIAGLFFVIMSFIMVSGFKHYSVSLDKVPAALDAMAIIAQTPVLGIFVTVAATVSLFACSLACVTAVSRILMSMARDGFLPAAIGKAHEKNATPAVAATVCAIFLFIVPALMTFKGFAELDVYNMTGTIATYGFLLAYILVAIGAVVFVARQKALTIGLTLAAIGGIGFMGMAVYGSIAPWPAAPCNTLPAIFGAYLVIGLIWHIVTKLGKQAAPTAELS